MGKIESIIGFRCRPRNHYPRVNRKCQKRGLPSFRHYQLTRGLGFLGLHWRPMINYCSYLLLNKISESLYNLRYVKANSERHSEFSVWHVSVICKQLMSLLASCVSCLSPWARQNFPAPLRIEQTLEQTLSHR